MAAVNDLSFDVQSGEIFGISGPNGAGKTTLFEVISGLDPADEGSILFNGEDITRRLPQKICQSGLARVFQSNACFDSLTVRENIAVGAVYGSATGPVVPLRLRSKTRERIEEILDEVGLSDKGDEIASNLPVLDRKRLMFASALSSEPKLLLLDEPVGGLNPLEPRSDGPAYGRDFVLSCPGRLCVFLQEIHDFPLFSGWKGERPGAGGVCTKSWKHP